MKEIMKSAVYCGTYHKYNCGSIFGEWVDLADFSSKDEFIAYCRNLHKDEIDPEFMFQDWTHIPASMVDESYVKAEIWQVINELRKLPKERISAFYDYCEDKGIEQDLAAFNDFAKEKKSTKKKMPYFDEYVAELKKAGLDSFEINYYTENTSCIVKINGHLVTFAKPEIETRFCFGYSDCGQGQSYEECQEQHRNFGKAQFIQRNLRSFDEELEYFKPEEEQHNYHWRYRDMYLTQRYPNTNIYCVVYLRDYEAQKERDRLDGIGCLIEKANDNMVAQYKEALLAERAKFEKRLNSYLKRYGTSKLITWTYWMDE